MQRITTVDIVGQDNLDLLATVPTIDLTEHRAELALLLHDLHMASIADDRAVFNGTLEKLALLRVDELLLFLATAYTPEMFYQLGNWHLTDDNAAVNWHRLYGVFAEYPPLKTQFEADRLRTLKVRD